MWTEGLGQEADRGQPKVFYIRKMLGGKKGELNFDFPRKGLFTKNFRGLGFILGGNGGLFILL